MRSNEEQNWYFTFGSGQPHAGCFIVFRGTYDRAREQMNRSFDRVWGFQYSEKEWNEDGVSQAERYNLKEIH